MHKILVIDDDPDGTGLLITLLELEGYQGSRLENWTDPLGEVQTKHPHLVIMDVYLMDTDGLELLAQLRAHPDPHVAGIPVLMMSAEDARVQCQSAGADGFIDKPFDLKAVVEAIQKILEVGV